VIISIGLGVAAGALFLVASRMEGGTKGKLIVIAIGIGAGLGSLFTST